MISKKLKSDNLDYNDSPHQSIYHGQDDEKELNDARI
jgi:hypothetical protein